MPFASKKQRAFLYSQHPAVAAQFEKDTPPAKEQTLPQFAKAKYAKAKPAGLYKPHGSPHKQFGH